MRLTTKGISSELWEKLSEHLELLSGIDKRMRDIRNRAKRERKEFLGNPALSGKLRALHVLLKDGDTVDCFEPVGYDYWDAKHEGDGLPITPEIAGLMELAEQYPELVDPNDNQLRFTRDGESFNVVTSSK